MKNKTKPEKNKEISDGDGKTVSAKQPEVFEIPVGLIVPSPFEAQTLRRKQKFETEDGKIKIDELGDSILAKGLLQPVMVRPIGEKYELVYGERRWLAHKAKGIEKIFTFVRDLNDEDTQEMQYYENHEREEPNALEDALRFKFYVEKGHPYEYIASRFSTTKKTVEKKLRLNKLIPEALSELSDGSLPLKHAYYLATFPDESQKKIVEREYAYEWRGNSNEAVTFDEFKEVVERNIVRNLATAPFDPSDTRLHIKSLTCWECPKRTGSDATLFEDDFKEDSCLDESCFSMKTNVNLKIKQAEIAESIPLPVLIDDDSAGDDDGGGAEKILEKKIKSVPLVTRRNVVNKKELPIKGEILTNQEILEEPECEFSVLSLDIDKGRKVYVCQNAKCPTHHPETIPAENRKSGPTDYELQQMEKRFQIQVAMTVRKRVLAKAVNHFDGYNSFWQNADLVELLLVEFICSSDRAYFVKQHADLFSIFKNFPKDVGQKEKTREFVRGLDPRQRDQLLFLTVFAGIGFMTQNNTGFISQKQIEQIAKSYAKIDYGDLDADVRAELAPDEFKEIAEEYRTDYKNDELVHVPRFWWEGFEFPED